MGAPIRQVMLPALQKPFKRRGAQSGAMAGLEPKIRARRRQNKRAEKRPARTPRSANGKPVLAKHHDGLLRQSDACPGRLPMLPHARRFLDLLEKERVWSEILMRVGLSPGASPVYQVRMMQIECSKWLGN